MPDAHEQIAAMPWEDFAHALQAAPKRGAKRGVVDEQALRDYFGDAELDYLKRLAEHAQVVRSRAPTRGNVVFLHGIMGSNLVSVDKKGDADLVWVNLIRLVAGCVSRLQLTADGAREADPNYNVSPSLLEKRTYARALLWLGARWNLGAFAYDWRKDIDVSAKALASFITEKFGAEPVHLVAHSMGGLVSRNFIRLHGELWNKMQDGNGSRGGRLIMLGTPNYGSFAIPQALTGTDKLVRLLERADLSHGMGDLLEVLNSFVGSYQMLPAPAKIPVSMQAIYRRESWGEAFNVSEAHLNRAFQFHYDLDSADTVDPQRMVYIAGCNRETFAGLTIVAPGEFDYSVTSAGDGRVAHELGLLKDVPTYYIDESHGDLAKNEKVLTAVDELLERGRTSVLPARPVASRKLPMTGTRRQRAASEQWTSDELALIAKRAQLHEAGADEVRRAEETLMRAALDDEVASAPLVRVEAKRAQQQVDPVALQVEVVLGDITRVKAPVVAVGHYKGVPPVRAVGAIDEKIGGWISQAAEYGMFGANLGEIFFIPLSGGEIGADAALLAGMGELGHFGRDDLHYLFTNVTLAVAALNVDRFASVIIGSGEGGLSKELALRAMLSGVCDATQRLRTRYKLHHGGLKRLILIEHNRNYYNQLYQSLIKFRDDPNMAFVALTVSKKILPRAKPSRRRAADGAIPAPQPLSGTRITIERSGDVFRFSALSETAVVPVREISVQAQFASGAAERLMQSRSLEEQEKYGRLLNTYLVPEEFQRHIDEQPPLTLILDRSTAAFPWEMASYRSARGPIFYGPDLKLTRQFRTALSSAPGLAPARNRKLKVLVIADPAPEPELQLPGARREGREVVKVLNRFKREHALDIDVIDRIGAMECDPIEILALLLTESFDIVHFAGHGVFDDQKPNRSGWIFGSGCVLSALEIFRARRVPRLVFANACFSAVVSAHTSAAAEMNRSLAGLAEAFFERGVRNYIGAGWPVDDDPAVLFASTFYEAMLSGELLGDSLVRARRSVFNDGATWGAYHHYGNVDERVLP